MVGGFGVVVVLLCLVGLGWLGDGVVGYVG